MWILLNKLYYNNIYNLNKSKKIYDILIFGFLINLLYLA